MKEATSHTHQEIFARSVCLFLAELLRTRNIDLDRASEIAAHVIERLDMVQSEKDFLDLIQKIEFAFEDIKGAKRKIIFFHDAATRGFMETLVKEYAIKIMVQNPKQSAEIMEDALGEDASIEYLKKKYPDFAKFTYLQTEKKVHQ